MEWRSSLIVLIGKDWLWLEVGLDRIELDEKRIYIASYVDIPFILCSYLFFSFLLDIVIVLSFMTSLINI